jgi:hypothetical protein
LAFGAVQAQTAVPNYIDTDQTWTASGNPYTLSANTYLAEGAFIRIEPGVQVVASKALQFIIDGRMEAVGKPDSMIHLEGFQIRLQAKAAGYDLATDTGAQFKYCHFYGQGTSGTYSIYNECAGVDVEHSRMEDAYYGIYNRFSSSKGIVQVLHSHFPSSSKYGYPIYTSGQGTLNVEYDTFQNQYSVYGYGTDIHFNRNWVKGTGSVTVSVYGSLEMECNRFENMASGFQLNCWGYYDTLKVQATGNTFDSCGGSFYPMMSISGSTPDSSKPIVAHLNRNNFLRYPGTGQKIKFTGTNKNPAAGWDFDFSNNYWTSQDTQQIADWIHDYSDDIMVWAKAHADSPVASLIDDCGDHTARTVPNIEEIQVIIYPNPSYGETIGITMKGGFDSYTLINSLGQIMETGSGSVQAHAELLWPASATNGIYHLVLTKNGRSISQTLIRQSN